MQAHGVRNEMLEKLTLHLSPFFVRPAVGSDPEVAAKTVKILLLFGDEIFDSVSSSILFYFSSLYYTPPYFNPTLIHYPVLFSLLVLIFTINRY